jgi:hypothetical protein
MVRTLRLILELLRRTESNRGIRPYDLLALPKYIQFAEEAIDKHEDAKGMLPGAHERMWKEKNHN